MPFDHDFAEEILARLECVPEDARRRIAGHLRDVVWTAMGRRRPGGVNSAGLWRGVVRPLFLRGFVRLPRRPDARRWTGLDAEAAEPCDAAALEAALEEYLALVQAGELRPPTHPRLGALGVDGWSRFLQKYVDRALRDAGV